MPNAILRFDMNVIQGENLLNKDYENWPTSIPV